VRHEFRAVSSAQHNYIQPRGASEGTSVSFAGPSGLYPSLVFLARGRGEQCQYRPPVPSRHRLPRGDRRPSPTAPYPPTAAGSFPLLNVPAGARTFGTPRWPASRGGRTSGIVAEHDSHHTRGHDDGGTGQEVHGQEGFVVEKHSESHGLPRCGGGAGPECCLGWCASQCPAGAAAPLSVTIRELRNSHAHPSAPNGVFPKIPRPGPWDSPPRSGTARDSAISWPGEEFLLPPAPPSRTIAGTFRLA
jgi:hypothetical protein